MLAGEIYNVENQINQNTYQALKIYHSNLLYKEETFITRFSIALRYPDS
jgi:hypothetical protein